MLECIVLFNKESGISYGCLGKDPSKLAFRNINEDFIAAYSSALKHTSHFDVAPYKHTIKDKDYFIRKRPYLYLLSQEGVFYINYGKKSAITSFISFDNMNLSDIVRKNLSLLIEDERTISGKNFDYILYEYIYDSYNPEILSKNFKRILEVVDDPSFNMVLSDYFNFVGEVVSFSSQSFDLYLSILADLESNFNITMNSVGNSVLFNIGLSNMILNYFDSAIDGLNEVLLPKLVSNLSSHIRFDEENYLYDTMLNLLSIFDPSYRIK